MKVYDILNKFADVSSNWSLGRSFYWIICDAKEIDTLAKKISLASETLEECKCISHSSKIDIYDSYLFIIFNVLDFEEDEIISKELNIYLGKDYIITISKGHSDIISGLLEDVYQCKNCIILKENCRPSILLYYILDRIISKNHKVISSLEAKSDKIEIDILKNPTEEHGRDLITLRRQVYKIRKYLSPLRYIGDSLLLSDKIIENDNIKYFENINNKVEKLIQAQEVLVQGLALVREAYESEIANRTNGLMKVFTIVATVLLPFEILSGIFGMSFNYIPLKNKNYGFYIAIGIMLLVEVLLIKIFKRNKWI